MKLLRSLALFKQMLPGAPAAIDPKQKHLTDRYSMVHSKTVSKPT